MTGGSSQSKENKSEIEGGGRRKDLSNFEKDATANTTNSSSFSFNFGTCKYNKFQNSTQEKNRASTGALALPSFFVFQGSFFPFPGKTKISTLFFSDSIGEIEDRRCRFLFFSKNSPVSFRQRKGEEEEQKTKEKYLKLLRGSQSQGKGGGRAGGHRNNYAFFPLSFASFFFGERNIRDPQTRYWMELKTEAVADI